MTDAQLFALALGMIVRQAPRTQEQLAFVLGVSQSTISRIEAGTATLSAFEYSKLAPALGTNLTALEARVHGLIDDMKKAAHVLTKRGWTGLQKDTSPEALRGLCQFVLAVGHPRHAKAVRPP